MVLRFLRVATRRQVVAGRSMSRSAPPVASWRMVTASAAKTSRVQPEGPKRAPSVQRGAEGVGGGRVVEREGEWVEGVVVEQVRLVEKEDGTLALPLVVDSIHRWAPAGSGLGVASGRDPVVPTLYLLALPVRTWRREQA